MHAIRPTYKSCLLLKICLALVALTGSSSLWAQDEIAELTARGNDLFMERVSCWICHGENAEGLVGPSLQHGPTPMDIQVQLDSNPQMAVIVSELNPDAEDLLAIATYIRDMNDIVVSAEDISDWRGQLAEMAAARGPEAEFFLSERLLTRYWRTGRNVRRRVA
jgi:mono/diheme cytochrome c family protein